MDFPLPTPYLVHPKKETLMGVNLNITSTSRELGNNQIVKSAKIKNIGLHITATMYTWSIKLIGAP